MCCRQPISSTNDVKDATDKQANVTAMSNNDDSSDHNDSSTVAADYNNDDDEANFVTPVNTIVAAVNVQPQQSPLSASSSSAAASGVSPLRSVEKSLEARIADDRVSYRRKLDSNCHCKKTTLIFNQSMNLSCNVVINTNRLRALLASARRVIRRQRRRRLVCVLNVLNYGHIVSP